MTVGLRIRAEAEREFEDAALWYEARRPGLGLQLVGELDRVLDRITESPRQFPLVSDQCRRGLLRRFPYGVYFLLEEDVAVVIAILHMHRRPDTWRSRE
ncbi:MAG: type II toxin-antitoxin system RelE/ParE family toxin [Planctomycetes bacterium]|nr:type II toxin-antitoxin system RelE/ParE family toxin [Planctomycetota bacterium]